MSEFTVTRGNANEASDSSSFNVKDSKPASGESLGPREASGEKELPKEKGNDSFVESSSREGKEIHEQATKLDGESNSVANVRSPKSDKRRSLAALRLQKVYRSFRTRRQLADCAVIIEQKWWKVLDLAELKRSSISFFDIEKHESALTKWSRATSKAAKVGKGLSKDEKARKLALQHWLEAIDPRHRYGHNLQFFYVKWLHCDSTQPFFYWLDIGEGREVELDRCSRHKLHQQCIKYLGPKEREEFEMDVQNGRFMYKESRTILDTNGEPKGTKWIFVLSACRKLYVGQKVKGSFQHSSFLAGGATLSAGRLVVEDGYLQAVWPHSGHYLPTEENFQSFMSFLMEHNVDLTHVQQAPMEDEEETGHKKEMAHMVLSHLKREPSKKWEMKEKKHTENDSNPEGKNKEEEEESRNFIASTTTKTTSGLNHPKLHKLRILTKKHMSIKHKAKQAQQDDSASSKTTTSSSSTASGLSHPKLPKLKILTKKHLRKMVEQAQQEDDDADLEYKTDEGSSSSGYETAEESFLSEIDFIYPKINMFSDDEEEDFKDAVPQEMIMKRINTHRRTKSYQLGQQLSCKWTTGAGPRIGCLRDYPSMLQFQTMEQANLSPRAVRCLDSPGSAPFGLRRDLFKVTSPLGFAPDFPSPLGSGLDFRSPLSHPSELSKEDELSD